MTPRCQCGCRDLTMRSRTHVDGIDIRTLVCPDCGGEGTRTENGGRVTFDGCLVGQ